MLLKLKKTNYFALFFTWLFLSICPSYAEKVDNIDNLVLLDDVVQCKNCHKEHGSQWPKSAHSGSVSDFKTLKAFKSYIESTQDNPDMTPGTKLRDNCFTCHAPRVKNASDSLLEKISGLVITAVDNQGTVKGASALNDLSKISIDCAVCHMINGMPEGEVAPNMLYGPGWDEHELAHTRDHGFDTIKSPYLMSSNMCMRCHNDSLAGAASIVKNMHISSRSHFMKANISGKTCQACHMMDGEMTIHNMPIYSGTVSFPIEKTADRIGMSMAIMTFLGICLNLIRIAASKREQRNRAMGVEICDRFAIMPIINTDELYPHEAGAAIEEQKNNEPDGNATGQQS